MRTCVAWLDLECRALRFRHVWLKFFLFVLWLSLSLEFSQKRIPAGDEDEILVTAEAKEKEEVQEEEGCVDQEEEEEEVPQNKSTKSAEDPATLLAATFTFNDISFADGYDEADLVRTRTHTRYIFI